MDVRELITKIGWNVDASGINKANTLTDTFKANTLGLVATFAAVATELVHVIKSTVDYGTEIALTSQRLGIGAENLQKFEFAAKAAGVESETFVRSLSLLSRRLFAAQNGSKEAAKAFAAVGIKDVRGIKDTGDLLLIIADRFKSLPDDAHKTGLAMTLFGRAGSRVIPFLNEGSEGIKKFGDLLQALGGVMDKDAIKKAHELEVQFIVLKALWSGIERAVGSQLIPRILEIVSKFINWIKANKELIGQGMKGLFEGMGRALDILYKSGSKIYDIFEAILKPFGGLKKHIKFFTGTAGFILVISLVTKLGGALQWITGITFGLDVALAPLTILIVSVSAAALLLFGIVQDWYHFMSGKDSLLGRLLNWEKGKGEQFLDWMQRLNTRLLTFLGLADKLRSILHFFGLHAPDEGGVGYKINSGLSRFNKSSHPYSTGSQVFGSLSKGTENFKKFASGSYIKEHFGKSDNEIVSVAKEFNINMTLHGDGSGWDYEKMKESLRKVWDEFTNESNQQAQYHLNNP